MALAVSTSIPVTQGPIGPNVVAAQARELTRARVSFDVPVRQDDPSAADDALNPANYGIEPISAPAVGVTVVSVEPVTSSSVDVGTDVELTPGAKYQLTVTGVSDLAGNIIAPPGQAAVFTASVPAAPSGRRFSLLGLLPEMNRREDDTGDLGRFLDCLQEPTDLLLADVDHFTDILDPDFAPEPFLDLMLAELGNPFPIDLSLTDKRRLANLLVAIYQEKGTGEGIQNAIRFFLGIEITITSYSGDGLVLGESLLGVDWILGPSGPFSAYSFEVSTPRALTAEERKRLWMIVDYMKPAHTHFRIVEPSIPEVVDDLELGLSELGDTWLLH